MPKGSEANDLFRIDAESLLDYSNNITGIVNADNKENTVKKVHYDFKIDIRSYMNMERNSISEETLQSNMDTSILGVANLMINIADKTRTRDSFMANEMGIINEL